jgi:hypothetical protein
MAEAKRKRNEDSHGRKETEGEFSLGRINMSACGIRANKGEILMAIQCKHICKAR